eukprot:7382408-Prymnesium_polylepis.1
MCACASQQFEEVIAKLQAELAAVKKHVSNAQKPTGLCRSNSTRSERWRSSYEPITLLKGVHGGQSGFDWVMRDGDPAPAPPSQPHKLRPASPRRWCVTRRPTPRRGLDPRSAL